MFLKRIRKCEQVTLPCKHVFHGECLRKRATQDKKKGVYVNRCRVEEYFYLMKAKI
jgi:hypothetical protein